MRPLRIAQVGPVATSIPPSRSSSVELMTSLLTEGLVDRGHQVTLFATGTSRTKAHLHATFPRGYADDSSLWPWEACELFNPVSLDTAGLRISPDWTKRASDEPAEVVRLIHHADRPPSGRRLG